MQLDYADFARTEDIDAILDLKKIAVVGLSSDPSRASYGVARYMQRHGYQVIPVNPNESEILGERAYPSLSDLAEPPDVVDVFRRPEHVAAVVDEAIAVGAKAVWLQLGVIDEQAAQKARDAGLLVVMDRCIKIEHAAR
jgi:uncharacterized protein